MTSASIDLSTAKRVEPPTAPPVTPMSDLQRSGVDLAKILLLLIAFISAILLVLIAFSEFSGPPNDTLAFYELAKKSATEATGTTAPDTLKAANDLLQKIAESRRASREFWLNLCQFLLLNLLLPVLTSILGYVFGVTKSEASTKG